MRVNAERLLETFLDLARIDSPTGAEGACADYCATALTGIGCEVRFDDSAAAIGSDTGNLIAVLPGKASGHARPIGAHGLRGAVPRRSAARR